MFFSLDTASDARTFNVRSNREGPSRRCHHEKMPEVSPRPDELLFNLLRIFSMLSCFFFF